jgi:hypothetical protein
MINNINQPKPTPINLPLKPVVPESAETVKVPDKGYGFFKPWSMEEKPIVPDKAKGTIEKGYKKIDFYL